MRSLLQGVLVLWCIMAPAQAAVLESPSVGAYLSGIGFISGWKCDATAITVRLDGGAPIPVLYGNERLDTHVSRGGPCQQRNTGFIMQINWGELGDGDHTIVAADNGREFARATFSVMTTGESFLPDAAGECTIRDFPAPGESARFVWSTSTQHLELVGMGRPPQEPPAPLITTAKLYWATVKTIQRANLDGSQVETLFTSGERRSEPRALAVDYGRGHMYWISAESDIWRANLDGSQASLLIPRATEWGWRYRIAVDTASGKVYWSGQEHGPDRERQDVLQRANGDGTQIETVLAGHETAFVLDSATGKLYFTIRNAGRYEMRRMNLDGSQQEILFDLNTSWTPRDIAVDATAGLFYWATVGEIWQASFNGIGRKRLYSSAEGGEFEARGPNDVAIDPAAGYLYWTEDLHYGGSGGRQDEIRRTRLDGSQLTILFSVDIATSPGLRDIVLVRP